MVYYISDTHFGEKSIIRTFKRPFKTTQEMDETILNNWNNTVTDNDTVWFLGDIGSLNILPYLKGRIHIIYGNHDDPAWTGEIMKTCPNVLDCTPYRIILGDGLILSHEPITFIPEDAPFLNIHGHLHTYNYGNSPTGSYDSGRRYFNVSCEQINYTPISIDEIEKILVI